jgi:hypothetical protein
MKINKQIKISEKTRKEIFFLYQNKIPLYKIKYLIEHRFGEDIDIKDLLNIILIN